MFIHFTVCSIQVDPRIIGSRCSVVREWWHPALKSSNKAAVGLSSKFPHLDIENMAEHQYIMMCRDKLLIYGLLRHHRVVRELLLLHDRLCTLFDIWTVNGDRNLGEWVTNVQIVSFAWPATGTDRTFQYLSAQGVPSSTAAANHREVDYCQRLRKTCGFHNTRCDSMRG